MSIQSASRETEGAEGSEGSGRKSRKIKGHALSSIPVRGLVFPLRLSGHYHDKRGENEFNLLVTEVKRASNYFTDDLKTTSCIHSRLLMTKRIWLRIGS